MPRAPFPLLAALALAAAPPAAAMVEQGPLAVEAAREAGCLEPEVRRLGQEGASMVYAVACAEGSPALRGRVVCGIDSCRIEPGDGWGPVEEEEGGPGAGQSSMSDQIARAQSHAFAATPAERLLETPLDPSRTASLPVAGS